MTALSVAAATVVSGVGSLTVGVSVGSAAGPGFSGVEPSSGATGNESFRSLESHPTQAFHLHHREYGVSSGPGGV